MITLEDQLITTTIEFFKFADSAAKNGGFWCSAGGGTANVIAGTIARELGVRYEQAQRALDLVGGTGWYVNTCWDQPGTPFDGSDCNDFRFDAETVAKAACRRVARRL